MINAKDKCIEYLVVDEAGCASFFTNLEEAEKFAINQIEICRGDDGWDEYVTDIVVAKVKVKVTHTCKQINRIDRPEKINGDGIDENGDYWRAGAEYKCNYKMSKL